ncbi:hypothetical protein L596_014738 [Steinernema carpocapsae]|uniref:Uncharacterized protein n=1 Tax=Steinernema carpocapsae TaxID=34508 RepID=A0A4U5NDL5_STECR|nr:hypothetical protein L596_014738 [Steinernema carpocapsae]
MSRLKETTRSSITCSRNVSKPRLKNEKSVSELKSRWNTSMNWMSTRNEMKNPENVAKPWKPISGRR